MSTPNHATRSDLETLREAMLHMKVSVDGRVRSRSRGPVIGCVEYVHKERQWNAIVEIDCRWHAMPRFAAQGSTRREAASAALYYLRAAATHSHLVACVEQNGATRENLEDALEVWHFDGGLKGLCFGVDLDEVFRTAGINA